MRKFRTYAKEYFKKFKIKKGKKSGKSFFKDTKTYFKMKFK